MGEAARKRRAGIPKPENPGGPQIMLANPVAQHFVSFIFANALQWEAMAHEELRRVAPEAAESLEPFDGVLGFVTNTGRMAEGADAAYQKWLRFRELVAEHCAEKYVVVEGSAAGQHVVICGAGPSLAANAAEWIPQADQVWGVNSALPYLLEHGHRVTHGLTVDQTPQMCAEWFGAPDVEYLLATTVHPHLTEYLTKRGRRIRYFNNFVGLRNKPIIGKAPDGSLRGMAYEDWLYSVLFHGTIRAGSGLNSVTRAIDVALCMGFSKITILGADCAIAGLKIDKDVVQGSPEHIALLKGSTFHADGGHALASEATPLTFGGMIDGRHWETKPDLIISAVWLVKMAKRLAGRLQLIGDTLPNALMGQSEEFLARLPALTDSNGRRIPIDVD